VRLRVVLHDRDDGGAERSWWFSRCEGSAFRPFTAAVAVISTYDVSLAAGVDKTGVLVALGVSPCGVLSSPDGLFAILPPDLELMSFQVPSYCD